MDEKLIKMNKRLNMVLRGFIYTAGIILLVVSILGFVFSYSKIKAFFIVNENVISKFIYMCIIIDMIFTGFAGAIAFVVGGIKFNLKNVISVILEMPVLLLTLVGYLLASEYITIAYDVSTRLFLVLFIGAVFFCGMKCMLLMIRDNILMKEDTTESSDIKML